MTTRMWIHAYGPFEYPEEDPSMSYTFYPEIKFVSLIDPGLTLISSKKKLRQERKH